MARILYRISIILFIAGLVMPNFILAQEPEAKKEFPGAPESFEEVWSFLKNIIEPLPRAVKGAWEEAVEIWKRMAGWFKNIWDSKVWPRVEWAWQKIFSVFNTEVEKRKEEVSQGLEEEKQELEEEATKAGRSLWEKLKDLIRK